MTVKEVKENNKFKHIFVNGNDLYSKDTSIDNLEVKKIETKKWLYGLEVICIEVDNIL